MFRPRASGCRSCCDRSAGRLSRRRARRARPAGGLGTVAARHREAACRRGACPTWQLVCVDTFAASPLLAHEPLRASAWRSQGTALYNGVPANSRGCSVGLHSSCGGAHKCRTPHCEAPSPGAPPRVCMGVNTTPNAAQGLGNCVPLSRGAGRGRFHDVAGTEMRRGLQGTKVA